MKQRALALSLEDTTPSWPRTLLSVGGSIVLCTLLFYAIALTQKRGTADLPALEELESVVLPIELPPPPTREIVETQIPIGTPVQFQEESVPDSPVRIQIEPVPVQLLDHSAPLARPGLSARFDLPAASAMIRPKADPDAYRVYDRSEVDQRPVIVYRKSPDVTMDLLRSVPNSSVTVMFVVNLNGQVEGVRLLRSSGSVDFDQLLIEAIADWEFRPAIKGGKTVRCWVQLPVRIRVQQGTSFEAR